MDPTASIQSIQQTIQAAVTPVFLLLVIASFLSVLSVRLGRIIDRARVVEETGTDEHEEKCLFRRISLINWSIRLFVSAALLVCLVVVTLFVGGSIHADAVVPVATLFILAMLLIIGGLVFFLGEVSIASKQVGVGIPRRR